MRNIAFALVLAASTLTLPAAFAATPETQVCADGTSIEATNKGYIFGFVQSWLCEYETAYSFVEILNDEPELVR